jgi:hypothetical protein
MLVRNAQATSSAQRHSLGRCQWDRTTRRSACHFYVCCQWFYVLLDELNQVACSVARRARLQACPYGLYAEQVSGTAFTAPRRYDTAPGLPFDVTAFRSSCQLRLPPPGAGATSAAGCTAYGPQSRTSRFTRWTSPRRCSAATLSVR